MDTTTTLVDYYAILEIPRTAAEPQIKEAVKKQRRQWYKRQNAPTTEKRREAEDRIRDISAAETTLLDPNRRAAYDRQLASYVPPAPETDGASEGQDWTARAVDLLRQNLPEAAHGAAREATDRKGSDHEAWAVRGRASLLMNRADSAVFEFSEAIHLQPNADEYHSDLGDAYSARGDLPRAFESYGTAARLAPDNRGYPVSIASVHLMAGRPDMAVAVLDPLHAADPRDEVCSVYLAMALSDWVWSTWTRTGAETSTITSREQIDFSTEKLARAMSLTFDDREVAPSSTARWPSSKTRRRSPSGCRAWAP